MELWKRHKHILLLSGISILLVGTIALGIYTLRVDKRVEYCIAQHNRLVDYLATFFENSKVPVIADKYDDDDVQSIHSLHSTDEQKDVERDGDESVSDDDDDATPSSDTSEQSEDERPQHMEEEENETCDACAQDTVEVQVV